MRYQIRLIAIFLAGALFSGVSPAGVIIEERRETLIQDVLSQFWGRAKNSRGEFIQPSSKAERRTVPITKSAANRAIDAGELSGFAMWCDLDWELHYQSLTKAARAKGLSDTQVAFVSFLHGAAQGMIANAMKGEVCNAEERSRVRGWLIESRERGLDGT